MALNNEPELGLSAKSYGERDNTRAGIDLKPGARGVHRPSRALGSLSYSDGC